MNGIQLIYRRIYRSVLAAALVFPAAGSALAESAPAEPARAESAQPRLAVLIVVDQLGRSRLDPDLPGGLGRLAREGLVFTRGELAHAISETCPGHVAIATGRHPGVAGASANYFVDREAGVARYCVEDAVESASVLGAHPPQGRSPVLLRVGALGDWLEAADPRAQVLAVSAKDRAAIALGGQHPTAVYWFQRSGSPGFTTSRYYEPELPSWVRAWNGEDPDVDIVARTPEIWNHSEAATASVDPRRPDDYPFEGGGGLGRTSGHPLRGETLRDTLGRIYRTPFLDELTLDFAAVAARELGLGDDEVPDLLAISLSAMDTVGHSFGPESHESRDALLRLDAWLGDWLEALEARTGEGRLIVALTSDHGALPLPEWLVERGAARCPVEPGRISLDALMRQLQDRVDRKLRRWYQWPGRWLHYAGKQITVDRALAAKRGVDVERVVQIAERWLESHPAVAEAWTPAEFLSSGDPIALRQRRSYDPERSGDLIIEPAEGCLIGNFASGTSHGSPHGYDVDVPIVFWGTGVEPGRDDSPATLVDIAPTLAHLLGLEAPAELDGVSLID